MDKKVTKNLDGQTLLVNLWTPQVFNSRLISIEYITKVLNELTKIIDAKKMEQHVYQFPDKKGITGVQIIAESHIFIHTWPELDYVRVEISSCKFFDIKIIDRLKELFDAKQIQYECHRWF